MHRLIRKAGPQAATRRLSAERGAVATIVSIMLGAGVVMGFGALTLDVGNLLWERRQLQNGADAAVLDLARMCGTATSASGACSGDLSNNSGLEQLVDTNANDGAGDLLKACAGGPPAPGVALPPCAAANAAQLSNCPPLASKYATNFPYVQAHTTTETQAGGTILPFILAQTITGTNGSSVGACARATWGAPQGATAKTPITISECEWDQASVNGTNYADPPVYNGATPWGYGGAGQPAVPTSKEVVLYTKYNSTDPGNACANWQGHDAPGAFSYLGDSTNGCDVDMKPPAWVKGDPGNSLPCPITDFSPVLGTVVDVPVHYCMAMVTGSGTPSGVPPAASHPCVESGGGQAWYYIKGWAKFYVSGYKVGGSQAENIYGTTEKCDLTAGDARCLRGWFTTGVIHADTITPPSSGGSFGSVGVVPAG